MDSILIDKKIIIDKLDKIIHDITRTEIYNKEISLFSCEYNVTSEIFIYILLKASKELCFNICDDFIDSLTNYSFNNLVSSILSQLCIQRCDFNI